MAVRPHRRNIEPGAARSHWIIDVILRLIRSYSVSVDSHPLLIAAYKIRVVARGECSVAGALWRKPVREVEADAFVEFRPVVGEQQLPVLIRLRYHHGHCRD